MNPARVLIISPRELQRDVWLSNQFETEDLMGTVDDVEIVAPRPAARGNNRLVRSAQLGLKRLLGIDLSFVTRPQRVRLQKHYPLIFVEVATLRELDLLRAAPHWRNHCDRAVCLVDEVWAREINRPWNGGSLAAWIHPKTLQNFDEIFVRFSSTVEPLSRHLGRPCHWLPPAVDTLRFCPWPNPPPRLIDFFAAGRRSPSVHAGVLDYAARKGKTYLFDTYRPGSMDDHRAHRQLYIDLIKRSRFFFTHRAKVDAPDETAAQEEMGFRFFEGAAGGAVLAGKFPRSQAMETCFGWPGAHFNLEGNEAEIGAFLGDLEAQPERLARISRENVRQSLLRHDWAYRWQEILRLVDLPPTTRLLDRLGSLKTLSDSLD